ncbi:hypothetical protein EJ08DRAFT_661467 [Tothia fuscella]|uniref:Uncharacterized protein n=1 Tax=Tothia fuscella TaxID=1048955 RepID=A0A9P4NPQ2_9PEZI|nr:hypothetical protein EJ08DRAFT_661467 [Tothia fuscella]
MYTPTTLLSLLPLLISSSVQVTPISSQGLAKRCSGPSINLIFFSDNNCTTTVPSTIYTRTVYGDEQCYINPGQLYSSVLIDHIDDQFIGTNSALQVGNTAGDTCDFGNSVKFNIATRDTVGQCQFIGINSGPGKPLKGGNEYRLTNLQ